MQTFTRTGVRRTGGTWMGTARPGCGFYFESCSAATRSRSRSPARMFGIA